MIRYNIEDTYELGKRDLPELRETKLKSMKSDAEKALQRFNANRNNKQRMVFPHQEYRNILCGLNAYQAGIYDSKGMKWKMTQCLDMAKRFDELANPD